MSRRGLDFVKAAKEVFERDGLFDARISDIAKRANVSYGAFYHYFDTKEQLFREVAAAAERRLSAPPDEAQPQLHDSPGEASAKRIDATSSDTVRRLGSCA